MPGVAKMTMSGSAGAIERQSQELTVLSLDLENQNGRNLWYENLTNAHNAMESLISEFKLAVARSVSSVRSGIESVKNSPDCKSWKATLGTSEHQFGEAASQLEDEGISNPDEFNALLLKAEELRVSIAGLEAEISRAEELDKSAVKSLADKTEDFRHTALIPPILLVVIARV